MRRVRLNLWRSGSIPLACVLLGGCASHALRCDAHLTAINPPEPAAVPGSVAGAGSGSVPSDVKLPDGGSQ